MDVVRLAAADARLLAARYTQHGNSQRRMRGALEEAGAVAAAERLAVLRKVEHSFGVDLGRVCALHLRRDDPALHPVERAVGGVGGGAAVGHGRQPVTMVRGR